MKRCHVVGAGEFSPALLKIEQGDFVIAADAGLLHLEKMGLTPDLFVGDTDSLKRVPENIPAVILPCEKDDTDILSALKLGLEKGYRDFHLHGVLGGKRFSHSFANIQSLSFLLEKGATGTLFHEDYTLSLLSEGTHRFSFPRGYFSLFSLSPRSIVSISGAKYELQDALLTSAFPVGVSNEGTENTLVTVSSGSVLLVRED